MERSGTGGPVPVRPVRARTKNVRFSWMRRGDSRCSRLNLESGIREKVRFRMTKTVIRDANIKKEPVVFYTQVLCIVLSCIVLFDFNCLFTQFVAGDALRGHQGDRCLQVVEFIGDGVRDRAVLFDGLELTVEELLVR